MAVALRRAAVAVSNLLGSGSISPGGKPWPHDDPVPTRRLSTDEIAAIVDALRRAAERAHEAGFRVAEVHLIQRGSPAVHGGRESRTLGDTDTLHQPD